MPWKSPACAAKSSSVSQFELLRKVIAAFGELGIEHMIVGSYASSYHGESRSTHDIDLVIQLDPDKIDPLVQTFADQRYYLSKTALLEGRMANLIDTMSGDKADFFLLGSDEDSIREFSRRRPAKIFDIQANIATAEDVILSKLRWDRRIGGSEQQRRDVMNILRHNRSALDLEYVRRHCNENRDLFESLFQQVQVNES